MRRGYLYGATATWLLEQGYCDVVTCTGLLRRVYLYGATATWLLVRGYCDVVT